MCVLGNQGSEKSSVLEVRSHYILSDTLFDGFGRTSLLVMSCLEAPAL